MEDKDDLGGLVQDCSISSALAMEILQSCTKPSILSTVSVLSQYHGDWWHGNTRSQGMSCYGIGHYILSIKCNTLSDELQGLSLQNESM